MRIYELLNAGEPAPMAPTNGGMIQPSAVAPPPPTQGAQPAQQPITGAAPQPGGQQQAGFWGAAGDALGNFMSTPQPIGGPKPPPGPAAPGTNAAGQPAFVDKAVNSTFIGDINRGLAQPKPPIR